VPGRCRSRRLSQRDDGGGGDVNDWAGGYWCFSGLRNWIIGVQMNDSVISLFLHVVVVPASRVTRDSFISS